MSRFAAFVAGALFAPPTAACTLPRAVRAPPPLIQGALGLEAAHIVSGLKDVKIEAVGGWTFCRGTVDGSPVVVSRAGMGGSSYGEGQIKEAANGQFAIKNWDEKPYSEGQDLPKLTRATVTKTFTGDIEGEGQVEYLMMYRDDGSATFVGFERVVGQIAGKRGGEQRRRPRH